MFADTVVATNEGRTTIIVIWQEGPLGLAVAWVLSQGAIHLIFVIAHLAFNVEKQTIWALHWISNA
jgi:hypothetical protein